MKKAARAIVLLADGARSDVFFELLEQGHLPNVKKYLSDPGLALPAVTSFPSTTGPAYLPFLTGAFPGTCNVPGIRWFDKKRYETKGRFSFNRYRSYVGLESFLIGRDLAPQIKTIFELTPDSYSIFNPIARGSGFRNKTRYSRIWYWYYSHLTDHWSLADEAGLKKTLKVLGQGCKFVFTVLPGIDEYSHLTHPRHKKVIERYLWLDQAIGQIAEFLIKRNKWQDTALWLVSDHGLSKTDQHFCLNTFLEEKGWPAFYYPLIFNKKGKTSASMVSGNGMAHIYFKNTKGWAGKITYNKLRNLIPDIFESLLEHKAIDIIACQDDHNSIRVLSRLGQARIRQEKNKFFYETDGSDPFGYNNLPNHSLSAQELLAATLNTNYPDAPFQIAQLFTSERTGDLVLSATPGYDLRLKYENPEHKASHGSLHRSHMLVPILCNQAYLKRPMRTVDVFPTILESLGLSIPEYVEGEAL
ncbi:MAG: alkaline phosphatase family protein [Pseudomonadota bacterium]